MEGALRGVAARSGTLPFRKLDEWEEQQVMSCSKAGDPFRHLCWVPKARAACVHGNNCNGNTYERISEWLLFRHGGSQGLRDLCRDFGVRPCRNPCLFFDDVTPEIDSEGSTSGLTHAYSRLTSSQEARIRLAMRKQQYSLPPGVCYVPPPLYPEAHTHPDCSSSGRLLLFWYRDTQALADLCRERGLQLCDGWCRHTRTPDPPRPTVPPPSNGMVEPATPPDWHVSHPPATPPGPNPPRRPASTLSSPPTLDQPPTPLPATMSSRTLDPTPRTTSADHNGVRHPTTPQTRTISHDPPTPADNIFITPPSTPPGRSLSNPHTTPPDATLGHPPTTPDPNLSGTSTRTASSVTASQPPTPPPDITPSRSPSGPPSITPSPPLTIPIISPVYRTPAHDSLLDHNTSYTPTTPSDSSPSHPPSIAHTTPSHSYSSGTCASHSYALGNGIPTSEGPRRKLEMVRRVPATHKVPLDSVPNPPPGAGRTPAHGQKKKGGLPACLRCFRPSVDE